MEGGREGGREGGGKDDNTTFFPLTCEAVAKLWCISFRTGTSCSFISSGVFSPGMGEEEEEEKKGGIVMAISKHFTLYHVSDLFTDARGKCTGLRKNH